MRFGTWNVRSLYSSLKTAARELEKYVTLRGSDGRRGHRKGERLYSLLWSREWRSSVRDWFLRTYENNISS
jgi:hypothetical protein